MNNNIIQELDEKEVKITDVVEKFHALDEKDQMFILGCMTIMQANNEKMTQQQAS